MLFWHKPGHQVVITMYWGEISLKYFKVLLWILHFFLNALFLIILNNNQKMHEFIH